MLQQQLSNKNYSRVFFALEKVENLRNEESSAAAEIKQLSENNLIKIYNAMVESLSAKHKATENAVNDLEFECEHGFWYFLSSEYDTHAGVNYWTCKCLICGLEKEAEEMSFRNEHVIIGEMINGSSNPHKVSYEKFRSDLVNVLQKFYNKYKKYPKDELLFKYLLAKNK